MVEVSALDSVFIEAVVVLVVVVDCPVTDVLKRNRDIHMTSVIRWDFIFLIKVPIFIFIAPSNNNAGRKIVSINSGSNSIPIGILNMEMPKPVMTRPKV